MELPSHEIENLDTATFSPLLLIPHFTKGEDNTNFCFSYLLRLPVSCIHKISLSQTFLRLEAFPSEFVSPRNVDVLLPANYHASTDHYQVLYVHDGQNLFDDGLSFSGTSWRFGETAHRLISENRIDPFIIVGIWNNSERLGEYMPQKPFESSVNDIHDNWFTQAYGVKPKSDAYLNFMVHELKPFIDTEFRTLSYPESTAVMGSSMGGLVSCYALTEYPQVFGKAACLSSSWTLGGEPFIQYLSSALPGAGLHKLYFDYGAEEFVGNYRHLQKEVDEILISKAYRENIDWLTARYPGAPHSEQAWADRLHIPLELLFKKD